MYSKAARLTIYSGVGLQILSAVFSNVIGAIVGSSYLIAGLLMMMIEEK